MWAFFWCLFKLAAEQSRSQRPQMGHGPLHFGPGFAFFFHIFIFWVGRRIQKTYLRHQKKFHVHLALVKVITQPITLGAPPFLEIYIYNYIHNYIYLFIIIYIYYYNIYIHMPSIFAVRPLLPHTHGVFCTNHLKGQQWAHRLTLGPPWEIRALASLE